MAELVDALVSGASENSRGSSTLLLGTICEFYGLYHVYNINYYHYHNGDMGRERRKKHQRRYKYMREIALDTETTGLSHQSGHRVIEIGCVEMFKKKKTGQTFHVYINPERDVPLEASQISGLTYDFLKDHPTFDKVAMDFLNFIEDSTLIIHNAAFDIGFLNAELKRTNHRLLNLEDTIDTLKIARKLFPGSPASLDALCKRYNIDLSSRNKHGALVDSMLLCEVYVELSGGRQQSLFKSEEEKNHTAPSRLKKTYAKRDFHVSQQELDDHEEFLKRLNIS